MVRHEHIWKNLEWTWHWQWCFSFIQLVRLLKYDRNEKLKENLNFSFWQRGYDCECDMLAAFWTLMVTVALTTDWHWQMLFKPRNSDYFLGWCIFPQSSQRVLSVNEKRKFEISTAVARSELRLANGERTNLSSGKLLRTGPWACRLVLLAASCNFRWPATNKIVQELKCFILPLQTVKCKMKRLKSKTYLKGRRAGV